FFKNNPIRRTDMESMAELGKKLECASEQKNEMLCALAKFVHLEPEFPDIAGKNLKSGLAGSKAWKKLEITPVMEREEIVAYVESVREENCSADLAFYALRDMSRADWAPFLKAALERNPVCIEAAKAMSDDALFQTLETFDSESIYDGPRLAQPDEVWNYKTGDGLEKAILLSNVWKQRHPDEKIKLTVQPDRVELNLNGQIRTFASAKGLSAQLSL
ncbi:MAG: hypothetical protein WC047_03050, partial [Kiritimatiellales bacterium]